MDTLLISYVCWSRSEPYFPTLPGSDRILFVFVGVSLAADPPTLHFIHSHTYLLALVHNPLWSSLNFLFFALGSIEPYGKRHRIRNECCRVLIFFSHPTPTMHYQRKLTKT